MGREGLRTLVRIDNRGVRWREGRRKMGGECFMYGYDDEDEGQVIRW